MAIALNWNSRVDLALNFDEFFDNDFTLCAWFMPQFPDSYINPIIGAGLPPPDQMFDAEKLAFFVMGTGEYQKSTDTRLFLRVGKTGRHFSATFKPKKWHHLAVVRSGDLFRVFIDSVPLMDPITNNVKAPKNVPLRLGQTEAWRHVFEKRKAQFYGLIGEVAVFTRAFSTTEMIDLVKKKTPLTGNEPDLLAAWLFSNTISKSPKLNRKFTLHGGAKKVIESQPRNNAADAKLLPMPPPQFQFELPVPKNQLVYVGQSPHDLGGSHVGARNFPFDLSFINVISLTGKPGDNRVIIDEIPFHAVSEGTVKFVDGAHESGKDAENTNSMFISVKGMAGFFWKHLHWKKGSEKVKKGDKVKVGDVLAKASDSGVAVGNFHLHTALVFFPDGQQPPDLDDTTQTVSVPIAFKDYQRLVRTTKENGEIEDEWEPVEVDIPSSGEILIVPGPNFRDAFKDKLTKVALSQFRDFARRRKLGTHEARRQM